MEKYVLNYGFHKMLSRTTVFNINNNNNENNNNNVSWSPNQHILSYEQTRDSKDWSNGSWKFSFAFTSIYFQIYDNIFTDFRLY